MAEDSVVALPRPGASVTDDPLLAVLRDGAKRMLMQAVEAEVEAFLATHAELADEQGRRRLVRNGHAPERQIETGIGPLAVRRPKLRDRGGAGSGEPIRFTSAILPAYLRRTKNLEELLPWLYLNPDSPDGLAFGQPCAPIPAGRPRSYAGSGGGVLADATGERRDRRFRQRFRRFRPCRPDPNGGSGLIVRAVTMQRGHDERATGTVHLARRRRSDR
jgi:hypothetical protein